MKKEKWFKPGVQTGWDKDMPESERRIRVFNAHKGDELAAGRSMQALANISTDPETKSKARSDAVYFYRQHHDIMRQPNRGVRLTPKMRRLPR